VLKPRFPSVPSSGPPFPFPPSPSLLSCFRSSNPSNLISKLFSNFLLHAFRHLDTAPPHVIFISLLWRRRAVNLNKQRRVSRAARTNLGDRPSLYVRNSKQKLNTPYESICKIRRHLRPPWLLRMTAPRLPQGNISSGIRGLRAKHFVDDRERASCQ
jgi:hypothetical protein